MLSVCLSVCLSACDVDVFYRKACANGITRGAENAGPEIGRPENEGQKMSEMPDQIVQPENVKLKMHDRKVQDRKIQDRKVQDLKLQNQNAETTDVCLFLSCRWCKQNWRQIKSVISIVLNILETLSTPHFETVLACRQFCSHCDAGPYRRCELGNSINEMFTDHGSCNVSRFFVHQNDHNVGRIATST